MGGFYERDRLTNLLNRWAARMRRVLFLLLIAVSLPIAASAQCPELDTCCKVGQAAEAAQDWTSLHHVVTSAKGCDDGWIAESFSEKVSILLAENWKLLSQLDTIAKSDSSFMEFVLKHLDETIPADRHAKIRELATTRCPKGLSDLCEAIAKRTQ